MAREVMGRDGPMMARKVMGRDWPLAREEELTSVVK
jgi:hypothetical protein